MPVRSRAATRFDAALPISRRDQVKASKACRSIAGVGRIVFGAQRLVRLMTAVELEARHARLGERREAPGGDRRDQRGALCAEFTPGWNLDRDADDVGDHLRPEGAAGAAADQADRLDRLADRRVTIADGESDAFIDRPDEMLAARAGFASEEPRPGAGLNPRRDDSRCAEIRRVDNAARPDPAGFRAGGKRVE